MQGTDERLPNGLRLITLPNPGFKTVVAMVGVRVGSRDEVPGLHGAAHFIEHMMFKGTETRRTSKDISKEIDSRGGYNNAFTDKEVTCYFVRMTGDEGRTAVDIVHDMIANPLLRRKDFEMERGPILAEVQMYEDQGEQLAAYKADEMAYGDHPMAHPIAGTVDGVKSMKVDDMRAFFRAYYVPARMVVVLSGDVRETTLQLARKKFGKLDGPRKIGPRLTAVPRKHAPAWRDAPGEMLSVILRSHGHIAGTPAAVRSAIAATALGGYPSARLEQSLREKRGLCYHVGAYAGPMSDHGSVVVSLGVEPGKFGEAVAALRSELEAFARRGPTEEELRSVKGHMRGHKAMHLDSAMAMAETACVDVLVTGELKTPEQKLREISKVRLADAKAAASIFRPEEVSVTVAGPAAARKDVERALRNKFFH